jgi:nucleotide-binding universal stress UspA family protein
METQILVPLDGSRLAEQALPCAMRLGQELPADLVLFRAVSTPPSARQVLDGADPQAKAVVGEPMIRANDYLQGMVHSRSNGSRAACPRQRGCPGLP